MGFFADIAQEIKARLPKNRGTISDPNFNAGLQFWTPGQPIWTEKDYRSFVRNGYRKNPTVYACINKITAAAAGIEWKLYTDREAKKTIDNHALLDLWRKPNPVMPGTGSFIEQCFGFWHMAGNNYIYGYRPMPDSPPLALWPLRPDRMKAVASNDGVSGYVYGYESNAPTAYDVPEILHMKFPGYDDDVYGLSPVEVASYHSDQQNEAMGWNTALMQNMGRPASVFMAKGILTEEQRNQIEQEIRKKYSGKRNAGRPLIIEADMNWQNMSLTPAELDFLKSYELGTRSIAAIFDIAPELVGDSAGKTFANVAEARQALYLENVLPKLDRFSDYLNSWLIPMYPDLCDARGNPIAYFTYNKKDIEALQALYAAQEKAKHDMAREDWMAGGLTLEEYCEAIGANIPKFGAVRRIGAILVTEESLEDYADQSLTEPALPPSGLPEPLNVPALPAPASSKQPALPSPKNPKPPKNVPQKKSMDANGIYQPDDVEQKLANLRAQGVEYITWHTYSRACDICTQNNGVTVEVGKPFPSGHLTPPGHPNCICDIVPAQTLTGKTNDMLDLLARKVAVYLEGYKVNEVNRYSHNHPMENGKTRSHTLQLRSMQVQAAKTMEANSRSVEQGTLATENDNTALIIDIPVNTTTESNRRSGDVYRAFLERYG